MHNTGGHSYEAKVRLLDDRDNSLDILLLAYMDQTMGMVIILPRVKTSTLQATKSWQPRNLLAATPLPIIPPLLRQMDLKLTASCADFKLELKIFCSYLFMKFCGCEARTFDQSVTIDQSLGGCYVK